MVGTVRRGGGWVGDLQRMNFWMSGLGENRRKKKGLHVAMDHLERDWIPYPSSIQLQPQP